MNRRAFIGAFGSSPIVVALLAKAQRAGRLRRIGWLANWDPPTSAEFQDYTQHLRALGWIDGQNLVIEQRYTGGNTDLLPTLADELIRLKVEIIVTEGTVVTLAAKKATSTIPIVVNRSGDPVGAGLVASLARPGANVTGTSVLSPDLNRKRLQILHELLPSAKRVGVLLVPANPVDRAARSDLEGLKSDLGMQLIFIEVAQADELQNAVDEAARRGVQVLYVGGEPLLAQNFPQIVRATQLYSMPTMVDYSGSVEMGGLFSYGPDLDDLNRQLAFLIDKILRGTKPADLPIQQPRKFELVISLKVAKSFGIAVPQSLLQRADAVIQ